MSEDVLHLCLIQNCRMARRFQSGTGVHALDSFIPKWNRRSRLGQFLGFSQQHLTLVANVRHLTTGYVSPQYHCVFDDLFTTVYGVDKPNDVMDALVQMLWENSRDLSKLRSRLRALQQDPEQNSNQEVMIILRIFKDNNLIGQIWPRLKDFEKLGQK